MELTTFLWISVFTNGILAMIWGIKGWHNFLIKVILFSMTVGSLYFY